MIRIVTFRVFPQSESNSHIPLLIQSLNNQYEKEKSLLDKMYPDKGGKYYGYLDVFQRDEYALSGKIEGKDIEMDIYAIVLLYRDIYQGHIYSWISPDDPSLCLSMGIRNRVDYPLNKEILPDRISHLLLEGVRRFSIEKGCNTIGVVTPMDIMYPILDKKGFKRKYVDEEVIGVSLLVTSLVDEDLPMNPDVYIKNDIQTPISESELQFLVFQ